ncbi:SDR family NAD(P)-dependent oxidoreductase [Actinomadura algeriensis]|uniref:NAD(P)-dependent dehydrogenase (Short-subunit alcohol dehydrogenase family) n=1 Tax=Actinomadura algeriensis TaxID=1679523 RepID=A0ABR9JV04_9ACTN|nr:SDR family NAD(P)-dependent oxidoreductase [Actinomadura algeriensis]MBE1534211.1 NAD(P)-dependent dehydrogenase (short-subunit alcohol dehydrogenase family) [Actinomadura algeriensis]
MTFDANRPVTVVTGASSGIGRSTARALLERGRRVIGVGRDPSRCADAEEELAGVGPFVMVRGDFTLMAEVERVAATIRELAPRLDVLINNAGGVRDRRIVTAEGTEATFAANHLAPFLLTRELMPVLRASAADLPPGSVRVITVSSSAHRIGTGLDWDDLQSLRGFHTAVAYGRAKLAGILFTRELARRAASDGIVAQAMHPGRVATNFASHGDAAMREHMAAADTVPPGEPAETLVWLATDPEGGRGAGRYFHRREEETPAETALDERAAARLWTESERLLARLGH